MLPGTSKLGQGILGLNVAFQASRYGPWGCYQATHPMAMPPSEDLLCSSLCASAQLELALGLWAAWNGGGDAEMECACWGRL